MTSECLLKYRVSNKIKSVNWGKPVRSLNSGLENSRGKRPVLVSRRVSSFNRSSFKRGRHGARQNVPNGVKCIPGVEKVRTGDVCGNSVNLVENHERVNRVAASFSLLLCRGRTDESRSFFSGPKIGEKRFIISAKTFEFFDQLRYPGCCIAILAAHL